MLRFKSIFILFCYPSTHENRKKSFGEKIITRSQDTKGTLKPFHIAYWLRVRTVELLRVWNRTLTGLSWNILSYLEKKEAIKGQYNLDLV